MDVTYAGHKWRSDGTGVYKDDVKVMDAIDLPPEIKSITAINALLVDDKIYFNNRWYT